MLAKSPGDLINEADSVDAKTAPEEHYPLPLEIDFERCAEVLGEANPNDPRLREIVEILFGMLDQIAAISFGVSPSQIACGKLLKIDSESELQVIDVVKSKDSLTDRFADTAHNPTHKGVS